jgi:hypothetical protein
MFIPKSQRVLIMVAGYLTNWADSFFSLSTERQPHDGSDASCTLRGKCDRTSCSLYATQKHISAWTPSVYWLCLNPMETKACNLIQHIRLHSQGPGRKKPWKKQVTKEKGHVSVGLLPIIIETIDVSNAISYQTLHSAYNYLFYSYQPCHSGSKSCSAWDHTLLPHLRLASFNVASEDSQGYGGSILIL